MIHNFHIRIEKPSSQPKLRIILWTAAVLILGIILAALFYRTTQPSADSGFAVRDVWGHALIRPAQQTDFQKLVTGPMVDTSEVIKTSANGQVDFEYRRKTVLRLKDNTEVMITARSGIWPFRRPATVELLRGTLLLAGDAALIDAPLLIKSKGAEFFANNSLVKVEASRVPLSRISVLHGSIEIQPSGRAAAGERSVVPEYHYGSVDSKRGTLSGVQIVEKEDWHPLMELYTLVSEMTPEYLSSLVSQMKSESRDWDLVKSIRTDASQHGYVSISAQRERSSMQYLLNLYYDVAPDNASVRVTVEFERPVASEIVLDVRSLADEAAASPGFKVSLLRNGRPAKTYTVDRLLDDWVQLRLTDVLQSDCHGVVLEFAHTSSQGPAHGTVQIRRILEQKLELQN
ncbi:MAG: hypothetical protein A2Z83_05120 [Omnitrophica bacterium GWA2_52_8]|nr:MAG: hypothetical protein A2Z83_05120 [Omnitrophica bacterium GWA2_52_8]